MKPILIAVVLALAACSTDEKPAAPLPLYCPMPPECRQPAPVIRTQGDLAAAYLDTRAALAECKTARDTLAACLKENQP